MRPWIPAQNPFLVAANSFLAALKMSRYHDSALAASLHDPFILTLYEDYHPLHEAYIKAYNEWLGQSCTKQSETLNLRQLLKLLASIKIKQWDVVIQTIYPQNTPKYVKLLPNRRNPFQNGGKMVRIAAVRALSLALTDDELLADIKTDVDDLKDLLDKALDTQTGDKALFKGMSKSVEAARVAICIGQFANLGALIHKYPASPQNILAYFALKTIRKKPQVKFTGHVNAGEVHTIVKRTLRETSKVLLSNQGHTTLKFYLSSIKNLQPDETFVELAHGEQTVLAGALGKLTNKFITVLNTSPDLEGEFVVELVY